VVTDSEPQSLYLINGLPSAPKKEEKQEQATTNADQSQKETSKKAPPKELKKKKSRKRGSEKKACSANKLFSSKRFMMHPEKLLIMAFLHWPDIMTWHL